MYMIEFQDIPIKTENIVDDMMRMCDSQCYLSTSQNLESPGGWDFGYAYEELSCSCSFMWEEPH